MSLNSVMGMRIGVVTTSLFFQREGGLQRQVKETMRALNDLGMQIRPVQSQSDRLADFDVIHVFDIDGNFEDIVWAKRLGAPVVLSPVLDLGWNKRKKMRAEAADFLTERLTNHRVHTLYGQTKRAMCLVDRVVTLGVKERRVVTEVFECDSAKVAVVPNGVADRFFQATAELFCTRFGLEPGFALCVGSIYPHKNQLGLARSLEGTDIPLVLIGSELAGQRDYLDAVRKFKCVNYIGPIDYEDPLLASAYAAAGVFMLPSKSEVMPLVVLEALAAGTPVILTRHNAIDLELIRRYIHEVDPFDESVLRAAAQKSIADGDAGRPVRAEIQQLSWSAVAERLAQIYDEL